MRAAVFHAPGDVRIESVAEPGEPGPGEVLIQVSKAAICGTDSAEWAHGPMLARPPVVLGHEFTGAVVAAGDGLSLAPGTRVVSGAGISCGRCEWCAAGRTNLCARYQTLGLHLDGGLAEIRAVAGGDLPRRAGRPRRHRRGHGPAAGRRAARGPARPGRAGPVLRRHRGRRYRGVRRRGGRRPRGRPADRRRRRPRAGWRRRPRSGATVTVNAAGEDVVGRCWPRPAERARTW